MTVTTTRVFPEWRNKSLDDALLECREMVESPEFETVARWREGGGLVVGHFQVYFPEEIVHAAGMLPVKMRGAPVEPTHSDSHFGSYLCSILKTSLELTLSGSVTLDMFFSHPICDAARNLAAIWSRNFDYPCQILYLPQNPNSAHSATYLRHEYDRVRRSVEEVAGCAVTEDALRASIAVFNKNRSLMRDLYDIKRETPWLVDADEAYVLVALAGLLPREEHNELMETALGMIRERDRRPQDRIRVVFEEEMKFPPGPFELVAVGHEITTDQVVSRKLEGNWPNPNKLPVTLSPIVVLQPEIAAFLHGRPSCSMCARNTVVNSQVRIMSWACGRRYACSN